MSVRLDYVRFVLPVHIGTRDFSTIDISPEGADCKTVESLVLIQSGWVEVGMHGDNIAHLVSPGSIRYARGKAYEPPPPAVTFPDVITVPLAAPSRKKK